MAIHFFASPYPFKKVYFPEVLKIHIKKPSQIYQNTFRIYAESEWTFTKAFAIILPIKAGGYNFENYKHKKIWLHQGKL